MIIFNNKNEDNIFNYSNFFFNLMIVLYTCLYNNLCKFNLPYNICMCIFLNFFSDLYILVFIIFQYVE